MEIPDLSKYKEKFTENGFIEKIHRIAKRAGAKLVYAALILYYSIDSNKMSIKDKAIIIGALGYLITPLDFIPDAIPLAGLGDDLGVLIYVLQKVWGNIEWRISPYKRKDIYNDTIYHCNHSNSNSNSIRYSYVNQNNKGI